MKTSIFARAGLFMLLSAPFSLTAGAQPTTNSAPAPQSAATVQGQVTSPDAKPVAGARVTIYDFGLPTTKTLALAIATTDDQGHFELRRPAAEYSLVVQAAKFGLYAHEGSSTDDQPLEIQLKLATTVRLTVIGTDGKPVAGVRVGPASMREPQPVGAGAGVVPLEVTEQVARPTDENGVCLIPDMPREMSLAVRVIDPRFITQRGILPLTEPVETTDAALVDAPPIRIARGGMIQGRVIRPDTGQPVPDVTVLDRIVTINSTGGTSTNNANAKTDADGKFQLTQLPPAQHMLSLVLSQPINAQFVGASSEPITLTTAQEVSGIELKLVPGPILHGQATVLGSGKPIAGATITVGTTSSLGSNVASSTTGADGAYAVCLLPGQYTLRISNVANQGLMLPQPNARVAIVDTQHEARVDFQCLPNPMPWVRGTVVDGQGRPVEGAEVIAAGPGGGGGSSGSVDAIVASMEHSDGSATTAVNGSFDIPFVTDRATLRVRKGDLRLTEPITIDANHRNLELTIQKVPQGAIIVHVVDGTSLPIAGAAVAIMWPREEPGQLSGLRFGKTGADGSVRFSSLYADSKYTVYAGAKGYTNAQSANVTVQAGAETDLPLMQILPADSFIAGHVVDENNQPLAGAMVQLTGGGIRGLSTRSGLDGSFRVEGLVSGGTVNVRTNLDGRGGQPTGQPVLPGTSDAVIVHNRTAVPALGGARRRGIP